MSKRKDPNRKRVRNQFFIKYGCFCFCCQQKFTQEELQLHHLKKWEHTHKTTLEESSLVCDCCHKRIHHNELYNKIEYTRLNLQIKNYKATH